MSLPVLSVLQFVIRYKELKVNYFLFSGNLQRSTITKHNESKEHKNALEADYMRRQLYDIEPTTTTTTASSVSESDIHLFRTVYFAAKENSPNSHVNKLLGLLKASGVDTKYCDLHSDTIQDIQMSLLHVLDEEMKSELSETKYYGLIIDESTDLSIHKKLVVYIRYVCPIERGSCMVWEINMGVCPRLEFDNIMFINCPGYDFYIYGAFEFLCNSIANL